MAYDIKNPGRFDPQFEHRDRIVRDMGVANRAFFRDPKLPPGAQEAFQDKQNRANVLGYLHDVEFGEWNPKSRRFADPTGLYPEDVGIMNAFQRAKGQAFEKYQPTYGMSEKQKERFFKGPPTSWLGYGYGDQDAARWNEGRYWKDAGKEFSRSALGDIGWWSDVAEKGLSQTLWPFDFEGPEGDLPRGWKDLYNYSNLMADFDQQGLGATEEQWEGLGYSEKEDIKKAFKDMTNSKWDYDPTYHPLTEKSGLKDVIDTFSEEYLTPSSDYSEFAVDVPNPFAFETTEDKTFEWTPLNTAEVGGMAFTGLGSLKIGKELMKRYGSEIPAFIRNNPKLAAFLGLTTPSVAAEFID